MVNVQFHSSICAEFSGASGYTVRPLKGVQLSVQIFINILQTTAKVAKRNGECLCWHLDKVMLEIHRIRC